MKIVKAIDTYYLETVYRIYDGSRLMATAYLKRDAEVIKAALEKDKEQREKEDSAYLRF